MEVDKVVFSTRRRSLINGILNRYKDEEINEVCVLPDMRRKACSQKSR